MTSQDSNPRPVNRKSIAVPIVLPHPLYRGKIMSSAKGSWTFFAGLVEV